MKFLAACAVLLCLAFAMPLRKTETVMVVIDIAHGGKDYGAAHDSYYEKQIAKDVAVKVKELTDADKVAIHFTRTGDEFVSLEERVKTINTIKPDIAISLHVNYTAKDAGISGIEFFVSDKDNQFKSKEYALQLENRFLNNEFKSRGVKTAPFYIIKNADVPVVVLEMGYLSNTGDRAYLTSQQGQYKIAAQIAGFIKEIK